MYEYMNVDTRRPPMEWFTMGKEWELLRIVELNEQYNCGYIPYKMMVYRRVNPTPERRRDE